MSNPFAAARGGPIPFRLLAGAALLGASAYFAHHKARQATAAHPPRGRFVGVDGVRLHFTAHGDPSNPPLVMLHGNGSMALELELSGLVERAARDFHVLVFDRPGYGHSERPAGMPHDPEAQATLFLAALRALEVKRPIVLGHSWGTLVAFWMGLAAPDELRALVLASGYYTPSLRLDTAVLGAPAVPVLGHLLRWTVSPLLGRLMWPFIVRRQFAPAKVSASFLRDYPAWMSLRPGQLLASAAESAMMPAQAAKLRQRERDLRVPTVIVAGEKDRLVMTYWQSGRLHERLPGTRLRVVPGAGHMAHHTATAEVLEAVYEAWHMSAPALRVPPLKLFPEAAPLPLPAQIHVPAAAAG